MRLFLIRHGETVDNVAGLYAGVRDSALTNHGVDQARRLGAHFVETEVDLTHIFASPLSRAFKTAEALRDAREKASRKSDGSHTSTGIVRVPDLIEQDFGFYEGKPFFARSDPKKTGRETHHQKHKTEPGFVDVESRESMANRADNFLDQHLLPLCAREGGSGRFMVAVVSHGILLAHLWRRLLLRLPRKSLSIAPEVVANRDNIVLEHLGGWSNTGYLELLLELSNQSTRIPDPTSLPKGSGKVAAVTHYMVQSPLKTEVRSEFGNASGRERIDGTSQVARSRQILHGWTTTILAIDSKHHLVGMKRQRGGIGRLAHDEGQRKLDSFFKRQKIT